MNLKMKADHLFSSSVVDSAQGHYAQKLLDDLMENYSSALRPVEDTDRALNVTLQITLSQIKDMVGTCSAGLIAHRMLPCKKTDTFLAPFMVF